MKINIGFFDLSAARKFKKVMSAAGVTVNYSLRRNKPGFKSFYWSSIEVTVDQYNEFIR